MLGFLKSLRELLNGLLSSLKGTLVELGTAVRRGRGSQAVSLLREGSPLESFVDSLLTLAFWVVVLTPFILFPVAYLFMSLMR